MKQHFLSECFLRGFTDAYPKRKGRLFEFDLHEGSQRGPCLPKHVGFVPDLYEASVPEGENPHDMEHFWSQHVENRAGPVLFSLYKSGRLPAGEDLGTLMLFIASLGVRVPAIRVFIESFVNYRFRDGLLGHCNTSESFREFISLTSIDVIPELLEPLRLRVRRDLTEGRMSNNVFLRAALGGMMDLFQFLATRDLGLRICEDSAPNLVCPDWPVRFASSVARPCDLASYMEDSVLVFRLNKRMVLFAGTADRDVQLEGTLSSEGALAMNRMAVLSCVSAHRFVYSADERFQFMGDKGAVWSVDDLRNALAS